MTDLTGSLAETYDDLDQHMIGDEAELTQPALGDVEQVDRLLRAVAWRRRRIAQAEELVAAEKLQLDEWLALQRTRFDASFLLDLLRGYHEARLRDDAKAKTASFPNGTLKARAGQPRWEIDPEFVEWAREHAEHLLRVKHEPDRTEIKKRLGVKDGRAVDENGVVVPGIAVAPAETGFVVET